MTDDTTPRDRREHRRTDDHDGRGGDDTAPRGDRPTLADCDHTHPRTGESFGDAMVYRRGPTVAADGGEAGAGAPADADGEVREDAEADEEREGEELADVDHTPPRDAEDANRVHERGGEHEEDRRV
jgi:hypothetical protein